MRNGTQFLGLVIGALGVAVLLRGIYHASGVAMGAMVALGLAGCVGGLVLIFRGHNQGR